MIFRVISRMRRRLLWNAIACEGVRAATVAMGMAVLLLLLGADILSYRYLWVIPSITFAAGVCVALARRPSAYDAARLIDNRLHLLDTLSTAVFCWSEDAAGKRGHGTRLAQREYATQMAATLDLRGAVRLRIPRRLCASSLALAAFAAALLTVRSHSHYGPGLRSPARAAILQLAREAKDEIMNIERKLRTPEPELKAAVNENGEDSADTGTAHGDGKRTDADTASAQRARAEAAASTAGDRDEKGDPAESSAEPPTGETQDTAAGQNGDGRDAQSKRQADSRQRRGDEVSGRQSAEQPGSGSTLSGRLSNAMSNLVSALRGPSSGTRGTSMPRSAASAAGEKKPGRSGGAPPSNQLSASDSDGEESTRADANDGNTASARKRGDGDPQPGSGAGRDDGAKDIKRAEQLDAMGRVRALLGRRAQDATGSAYVEVKSGRQDLVTPYTNRKVEYSAVLARADRDDVSLLFRDYVENYFRELKKAKPGRQKKQPR